MSEFQAYLQLGFEHILDLQGLDHVIFLIAISCSFDWKNWKSLLILITAFTLGHSVTLALAAFGVVSVNRAWIEIAIAGSIVASALVNLASTSRGRSNQIRYILALLFGLIHGFGFSGYFAALLGSSNEIMLPLFSFNLGIELAQVLVVFIFMTVLSLLHGPLNVTPKKSTLFFSGAVFGIGLMMILERI